MFLRCQGRASSFAFAPSHHGLPLLFFTIFRKHDCSNAFKLYFKCPSTGELMLNSTVRTYIVLALIFALVGGILFFMVSLPPSENPPKGPIEIGVGPVPEAD